MVSPIDTFQATGRHITEIEAPGGACTSELMETEEGQRYLVWKGPETWMNRVEALLEPGLFPALADPVGRIKSESVPALLLDCGGTEVEAFDIWKWRNLPSLRCIAALRRLAETVRLIHDAGWTLDGLERSQLLLDPVGQRLLIGSMPGLRPLDDERETLWRDMRLFGELAYENFLEHEYPGGHKLVTILQEPTAMAETGLTVPGLPQLLAGCVTPYGDLAYGNAAELMAGLKNMVVELTPPIRFRVGARSTQGSHIFRQNNQDSCGHVTVETTCGSRAIRLGFFCVADGIGGIDDGERASSLAVRTACSAFVRAWNHYDGTTLRAHPDVFAKAIAQVTSQRLVLEGEFSPEKNRGGTTFTGVLLAEDRLGVCHVGDSRAVLIRNNEIIPLTRQHTLAAILSELGEPVSDDESDASHRTIARFLSTGTELEWPRIDGLRPEVLDKLAVDSERAARGVPVEPGDLLVLTSDGTHGEVGDDGLVSLARRHSGDPEALCEALIDEALQNIGKDNATALAVLIERARRSH